MKGLNYSLILSFSIVMLCSACNDKASTSSQKEHPVDQVTSTTPTQPKPIVSPSAPKSNDLVNNPTPLPQGYQVDTRYLKQPLLIDFNGDKQLDAFRVLKNPNKTGMKYLFEFRIANTDQVYFYENDDESYDLNFFGQFEVAKAGEKFVDALKLENDDLPDYEHAPEKARLILKYDGITTNTTEETCATSLFYLENEKINRIFLC